MPYRSRLQKMAMPHKKVFIIRIGVRRYSNTLKILEPSLKYSLMGMAFCLYSHAGPEVAYEKYQLNLFSFLRWEMLFCV